MSSDVFVPTSGAISLSNVFNAFPVTSGPVSLGRLRGTQSNLPSTGAISMSQLRGLTAVRPIFPSAYSSSIMGANLASLQSVASNSTYLYGTLGTSSTFNLASNLAGASYQSGITFSSTNLPTGVTLSSAGVLATTSTFSTGSVNTNQTSTMNAVNGWGKTSAISINVSVPSSAGLQYSCYSNNTTFQLANSNIAFFSSPPTPFTYGVTSLLDSVNEFALGGMTTYFAISASGYFLPSATGTWTFTASADDLLYLWLGSNASSPSTTNCLIFAAWYNSPQSASLSLTAGTYYPMLLYYGQGTFGYGLNVSFSGPGVATTYNGTGYYFNGTQAQPILNFDASVMSNVGVGNAIAAWSNTGTWGTTYNATGYNTGGTNATLGSSNGYYHVAFNRTYSQYFAIGQSIAMNWFGNSNAYNGITMFAVAQYTGTVGSYERFIAFGNGPNSNIVTMERNSTNYTFEAEVFSGTGSIASPAVAYTEDGGFHIFIANMAVASNGLTYTIYRDTPTGVAQSTSTLPANRTTTLNYIARSQFAADAYLNGNIRQILFYASSLSSVDMSTVYLALRNKWGLSTASSSLPAFNNFLPTVTSGTLSLWLDACSFTSNGQSVSTWSDSSSYVYSFTQATGGYQPTVVTNVLNSRPGIKFSGGQYLSTSGYAQQFCTTNTLFFVVSGIGGSNIGGLVLFKGTSTPNYGIFGAIKLWMGNGTTTETATGSYPTWVGNSQGYFVSSSPIGTSGTAVCMQTNSTTNITYYLNNIAVSDSSTGLYTSGADSSYTYLYLGGPGGSVGATSFTGYIHEMLHYSGALSSNDVSSVNAYLINKWGLTLAPALYAPAQSNLTVGSNNVILSTYCSNCYPSSLISSYATQFYVTSNPNSNAKISGSNLTITAAKRSFGYNLTIAASNAGPPGFTAVGASETIGVTEVPFLASLPVSSSGLVGAYFGDTFNVSSNVWYDVSGSGNHVTSVSGSVTVTSGGIGIGIGNGYAYLSGNTSTNLTFPAAILPSTYTLFHVARYADTTNRQRIFSSSTTNWLSGFWNTCSGVAYHNAWITPQQDWSYGVTGGAVNTQGQTWMLSTDQLSLYRANGYTISTAAGSTGCSPMTINYWYSPGTEVSDWQIACVLVFNYALTSSQYKLVEAWLSSLYGIYINSSIAPCVTTGTLTLWLDANSLSAGTVTSWTDKSSSGYVLSQSTTAYKPTLVASAIVGQPGLQFVATSPSFLSTTSYTTSFQSPNTLFFVISGAAAGLLFYKGTTASNWTPGAKMIFMGNGTSNALATGLYPTWSGSNDGTYIPTVPCTGPSVVCMSHTGLGYANMNYYINGSFVGASTPLSPMGYPADPGNYLSIGGPTILNSSIAMNSNYTGYIHEVQHYNAALSSSDIATVNSYLMSKWPITTISLGSLPTVTSGTLSLWLDANTIPTYGSVPVWRDGSGHSNTFKVGSVSNVVAPTCVLNVLGSNPGVYFNGSANQYMVTSNYTQQFCTTNTLFFVVSGNTGGQVLFKGTSSPAWNSAGEIIVWMGDGTTTGTVGNYPSWVGNSEGYFLSSTAINPPGRVVCMQTNSTSSLTFYIDNNPVSNSTNTSFGSGADASYTYLYLGGPNVTYPCFTGYIHEILHYNGALSSTDTSNVNFYLMNKWGV